MFNFSIKESLNQLKLKKYDNTINKTIDYLNDVDEYQLKMIAFNGIKLNNLIRLTFNENIGFRCFNIQQERYGRLYVCKNIERFLNEKYKNSFVKTKNIYRTTKNR